MSKPKLEWAEKGEAEDFDAAEKFLSLLCSDTKAKAFATSLRDAKLVEHAAKDLLRAHLPLLPSDESHVDADLKRIHSRRDCKRTSSHCGGRLSPDLRSLLFRRERTYSLPNSGHH